MGYLKPVASVAFVFLFAFGPRGLGEELGILPPHSVVFGKSLGEWSAEWWRWGSGIPRDRSPILDADCEFARVDQSGPVFFLAGNFGGKTERTCKIPCGKFLFFPIVADLEWVPQSASDCPDAFSLAKLAMNNVPVLECEIDGVPVPDLRDHREEAPACFNFTVPPDNIWGIPPGTYGPAASDGYWLMLEPIVQGEHTIHFKAVLGDNPVLFSLDVTYHISSGPEVLPPHSTVAGKALGEWSAQWWKAVASIPKDRNPLFDPDGRSCLEGQPEEVFFLYGTAGGSATRTCTVPAGKPIFFPILNDLEWVPTSCQDCPDCFSKAKGYINAASDLECEVDGVPVPDLWDHREESPSCFEIVVPEDNIFGILPGTYDNAAADGYWLMLEPLCPGHHTIHIKGVLGDPPFSPEVTFHLYSDPGVVPPHSTVAGKTLGDWSAEWWKSASAIPKDTNPILDIDGRFSQEGQPGEVFFLWGDFGGPITRTCKVPCGKPIFFPILNDLEWVPTSCRDCPDCFAVAKQMINLASVLNCEIDGVPLPDLWDHREEAPACFAIVMPPDNIFGVPPDTYDTAACDGYWLMLEPLSPGLHRVRFGGELGTLFSLDVTYYLDSGPCQSIFRRGDSDGSGTLDLTDAIYVLTYQYLGGEVPKCMDAADNDDNGTLEPTDIIYFLTYQYLGGPEPMAPGPYSCGSDVEHDEFPPCVYPGC